MAFDRMRKLVAEQEAANTVRPRHLPIDLVTCDTARCRATRACPARTSRRRGLSVAYGDRTVLTDVALTIRRGEFVVVTGPVGAGKSTLLRALLGLAWQADVAGEVRWNGAEIADRAAFLVPPNAAFLPQVPQLISDSVGDNVGFGAVDPARLATALRLAALDDDIAAMPDGVER